MVFGHRITAPGPMSVPCGPMALQVSGLLSRREMTGACGREGQTRGTGGVKAGASGSADVDFMPPRSMHPASVHIAHQVGVALPAAGLGGDDAVASGDDVLRSKALGREHQNGGGS